MNPRRMQRKFSCQGIKLIGETRRRTLLMDLSNEACARGRVKQLYAPGISGHTDRPRSLIPNYQKELEKDVRHKSSTCSLCFDNDLRQRTTQYPPLENLANKWINTGFSSQGRAKLRVFRSAITPTSTQFSPFFIQKHCSFCMYTIGRPHLPSSGNLGTSGETAV